MQEFNFNQHITQLLKTDNRLVDDEKDLQINVLRDLVNNLDSRLIELLISDDKVREKFFIQVKDVYVFKQNEFIFYLDSKVLDGSYTQYANRIGLASRGKFLTDSTDYVLDFPYKDCVLEGGQSTEEGNDVYFEYNEDTNDYVEKSAKRKEIFYNNIIAKDEIDRLLEPKAFQKIVRYDANGETIPTSFTRDAELNRQRGLPEDTITDNLIIKGNNLLALHSLEKEFKGKVKLIYIDPPYNTGNDDFKYNDNFNHSTWLTFMTNRLKIAEKLLCNDGVLFVQCDDNEYAYLKVLMDNSLESLNFTNCISVKMSEASGTKMSHIRKRFLKIKENIVFYKKSDANSFHPIEIQKENWDEEYNKVFLNFTKYDKELIDQIANKDIIDDNDLKVIDQIFEKVEVSTVNKVVPDIDKEKLQEWLYNNSYRIFRTAASNSVKRLVEEKKIKLDQNYFSILSRRDKNLYIGKSDYSKESKQPRCQVLFAEDYLTSYLGDFWDDISTTGLEAEGVDFKNGKKPEKLIERILQFASNENDVVLDFHLGSGTTAAVAHKMNRQYIGIEQMDYVEAISLQRLNKVIAGEQGGVSKDVNWQSGGSFVYAELAKNNETAKEHIEACTNLEELVQLFEELNTRYFLDYNVRIKDFKENIVKEEAFVNLSLARQKEIFKRMLDNNQLYVNLSEVEDARYKLSDDAIRLTKDFYQIKN
ncbi:site-specific DNA-methyltransferase [Myroides odoratimimus]|uniref:site-specific DNA-methyltransferase n=1 Tax=Myroides odoratimimus TaxID=76832 RepID=UPI002576B1FB|nr:site-specific DNA-methyltransferase [Myroides odoratimimus]MDM1097835.1 site-specific DNA-methyltransferase [Myroides odoratimimus]